MRAAAACVASLALAGHSPYGQWAVYRKLRLIIVVDGTDTAAVTLGEAAATALAAAVPDSRALMARARDLTDVIRLLQSKQLDVALLKADDALAALQGVGPAADGGSVPLRGLARFGRYLVVSRADLPDAIAHELAEALSEHRHAIAAMPGAVPAGAAPAGVPAHPGARPHFAGE